LSRKTKMITFLSMICGLVIIITADCIMRSEILTHRQKIENIKSELAKARKAKFN